MNPNRKPNILFIFSDQQHWEALGFRDPSFDTPNLDRFAASATVFSHAFCTTPQCSPSRSSLLTGFYPSKTGVIGNIANAGGNPLQMETIGPKLQRAGYATGYFGKWHLGHEPVAIAGWDEELGVSTPQPADTEATEHSIGFLKQRAADQKPFALFVSLNNPHDVYHFAKIPDPAPGTTVPNPPTWTDGETPIGPAVHRQFMEEDQGRRIRADDGTGLWQHYRKVYREKTGLFDACFGRIIDALDELNLRDNTLIIFTSDHGDMDGQHRLIFKGPFMYEHLVRVPLIVQLPAYMRSAPTPGESDVLTVNVDIVPTIADFAGATCGPTDGVSLKPLLTGAPLPAEREFAVFQYYSKQNWVNPIRAIRTRRFKYVRYRPHEEELYHLEDDPHELHNLANCPDFAAIKSELNAKLNQWMAANGDPFETQQPTRRDGSPL